MVSAKDRKKLLKAPDSFQKKALKLVDWCVRHQIKLAAVASVLVSLGAVGLVWKFYDNKQADARLEKLGGIEATYNQETTRSFQEKSDLEKQIADITEQIDSPDTSKDEKKKNELNVQKNKLQTKLDSFAVDHSASGQQFLRFYKEHIKTKEGLRSGINYLVYLIESKKLKDASEFSLGFIKNLDESLNFYQYRVRLLRVNLLEELKSFRNALDETKEIFKFADEENEPQLLLTKARLENMTDKKDDALKTLDEVITKYNASPEAQKAQAYKYIW